MAFFYFSFARKNWFVVHDMLHFEIWDSFTPHDMTACQTWQQTIEKLNFVAEHVY